MKLINKQTGEIGELKITEKHYAVVFGDGITSCGAEIYSSLAELNEEWEDYEGPKEFYFISGDGGIATGTFITESICRYSKEIGNYFETKEEAEKAVEKLKAWKRLKDKGFRFKDYTRKFDGFKRVDGSVFITAELNDEGVIGMIDDLNICFGDGE